MLTKKGGKKEEEGKLYTSPRHQLRVACGFN